MTECIATSAESSGSLVLHAIVSAAETLMRLSARAPVERHGMEKSSWTSTLVAYAEHERGRLDMLEEEVRTWYEGDDLKSQAICHLDAIGILSTIYREGTIPEGFDEDRLVGAIMMSAYALMTVAEQADDVLRRGVS